MDRVGSLPFRTPSLHIAAFLKGHSPIPHDARPYSPSSLAISFVLPYPDSPILGPRQSLLG